MIDKQFIVDDINDFLKPNNQQWKTYFDKAECKAILDAIEKSNKYEKMVNAWEEVIAQLKARRDYYEKKDYGLFVEVNACINIIESLLEGVTE